MHMKSSLALIVTLASGLALNAAAQTMPAPAVAAPAGPAKIAVIQFQAAVARTNEGQRNFADVQKKFGPKKEQLQTLNTEVGALTKELQTQGDKLSDEARASKVKSLEEKKKRLQRDAEDAENEFKSDSQEIFNGLASKVYEVLLSYAQQQGYSIVLDVSQEQNPVLFANKSTDITQAIVDAYNVKSGVPAPPAQPAGASAPSAPAKVIAAPPAH
jgi:outer membrane protein